MTIIKLFSKEILQLFVAMTPYLVLGMFMAGLLHVLIKEEFIAKHIGKPDFWSVVKSSLFGVPLPLCSCGVVPMAVYLKDSGASRSSIVSFLISTPQTGVDSIIAAYGLLGPAMAVIRPIAAFFSGLLGGGAAMFHEKKAGKGDYNSFDKTLDKIPGPLSASIETANQPGEVEACGCGHDHCRNPQEEVPDEDAALPVSGRLRKKVSSLFSYGFVEFTDDIAVSFIAGLVIAGIITLAIPDGFFSDSFVGSGISGMLLMVIIGIPFYTCSTSSIPIAAAFIMKGISPGAAFVFLMAGPATNAATLNILRRQFGLRITATYLAAIIAGSLIFGYIIDFLTSTTGISFFSPGSGYGGANGLEESFSILELVASAGFLLLLMHALAKRFGAWYRRKSKAPSV
jgi:uncharacterized protein